MAISKLLIPTTLLITALMLPMAAFAADDVVVAKINGQEIKKSDVMREMSNLPAQLQQVPVEQIYPQLLERMIDAKLVVTEAYKAKLNETDDFKSRLKRAEERILADTNLRNRIKPMITDEKLKARYDAIVSKSKPEDEVKASHILVKDEKEAKDIIEKLSKGGDFAKLAAEKSTDTGSAKQGGDLGFFAKGSMVPEFAKAAFDMKPGEVSKTPVKTEFGFHIIKVTDRRKAAAVPFEKVRPQLEAQLSEEMANEYVEGLKKNVKIERFNLDGTPLVAKAPEAAPKADAKPADKK